MRIGCFALQQLCDCLLLRAGKPFCVLGFGSSSYPRFCAAADRMQTAMLAATGSNSALLPPAKADAVVGEDGVVWPWLRQLVAVMQDRGWLSAVQVQVLEEFVPASGTATVRGATQLHALNAGQLQCLAQRCSHWHAVTATCGV